MTSKKPDGERKKCTRPAPTRALTNSASPSKRSRKRSSQPPATIDTTGGHGGNGAPAAKELSPRAKELALLPEHFTKEWSHDLVDRARGGDETTAPVWRLLLRAGSQPLIDSLGGNAAWQAELTMVSFEAGKHVAIREAMHRQLAKVRQELGGPNPTVIESLLASRAALCWFAVGSFEARYARERNGLTIAEDRRHQKRIDQAHQRLLSSLRTLAAVRKLALPTLQMNVERQQVNVVSIAERSSAARADEDQRAKPTMIDVEPR
jgi:hypothetical protein